MAPIPLCFIVSKPTTLTKADQQRRRSKALSHAAIVSFTRRASGSDDWIHVTAAKGKGRSADKRENTLRRVCSRHRKHSDAPHADKNASLTSRPAHTSDVPHDAPSLDYALYEELDPFLRPATSLNRRERNVLHRYLLTTPTYVYGTQPGTLYCPVRDMNVPQIQVNHLWLQWTLLYAERFAVPDNSQKVVTLLARRAKIYAYMNELLADASTCVSDTTLTGLAFGSLVEWQVGSLELARQHLGFVRHTLLPKRSGVRALSFFAGLCIYSSLLSVGLGIHAFASSRTMAATVQKFVRITVLMQQQSAEKTAWGLYRSKSSRRKQNSESSTSLQEYMWKRQRVFGPSSKLHGFLVPMDPEDTVYPSHQLALLWVLNKMLLELRDDLRMSAEFLDTLDRYVESHDDPSPFGSGGQRQKAHVTGSGLKPFTLTSMIGYISCSYLPQTNSETFDWTSEKPTQQEAPLLRFWENVDMCEYIERCVQFLAGNGISLEPSPLTNVIVELFRLLSKESKYKVAQQLSAWLIGPRPGDSPAEISEDGLEALGEEMKCAWLEQTSGCVRE